MIALRRGCSLALLVGFALPLSSVAKDTGSAPSSDKRLLPLVGHRTSEFPFSPPQVAADWPQRAEAIRRRVQVSAGLWPPPPRREPRAVIHGLVDRGEYTVEKVYLESFPGHYVTGNLYRPKGPTDGKRAGVLCPYGHWPAGRFMRWRDEELARQLASGAERYEVGGRYPIQARCVQLARMGCVVFVYDMLGYGDSTQLSFKSIHQPSVESIVDGSDSWSFYSTQAELRLQGPLGVQTFNSQCALDWLSSLPDVDPERIAVTGGSSGATQTLMLSAVDPRPVAAFPVVMVSTAMQGGCGCENACGLRIGMGNVDIAACFAPKPLGMASADDWTREFDTKGFPELQQLYRTLNASERIMHASLTQFPHNYNYASRAAMYPWLNRWLKLGASEPIIERDFVPLTEDEMRVWNAEHPAQPGGPQAEPELLQTLDQISKQQMVRLLPKDAKNLAAFREIVGAALEVLVAYQRSAADDVQFHAAKIVDQSSHSERWGTVANVQTGAELPTVALVPKNFSGQAVLWIDSTGKRGIRDRSGHLQPSIAELLQRGVAVVSADLLYQGELNPGQEPLTEARTNDERWPIASLTYGYNRTVVAHRAGDILTLAAATREAISGVEQVHLLATEGTAAYAVVANALAGEMIDSAAIDSGGFRFEQLTTWRDANFLPGAVKYGDLPAILALAAPRPLLVAGESIQSLSLAASAYRTAEASQQLTAVDAEDFTEHAVEFLLNRE